MIITFANSLSPDQDQQNVIPGPEVIVSKGVKIRNRYNLVTDGNTTLCCRGLILALFQSTTTNEIDSEHTQDY